MFLCRLRSTPQTPSPYPNSSASPSSSSSLHHHLPLHYPYFSLFLLVLTCNDVSSLGYPPEITVYPALLLLLLLVFSIICAYTIIVYNLIGIMSILEELSEIRALFHFVRLIGFGYRLVGFGSGLFEHTSLPVRTMARGMELEDEGDYGLDVGFGVRFGFEFVVGVINGKGEAVEVREAVVARERRW